MKTDKFLNTGGVFREELKGKILRVDSSGETSRLLILDSKQ